MTIKQPTLGGPYKVIYSHCNPEMHWHDEYPDLAWEEAQQRAAYIRSSTWYEDWRPTGCGGPTGNEDAKWFGRDSMTIQIVDTSADSPVSAPHIPRSDDAPAPPWALVLAGVICTALAILTVIGAIVVTRWLLGI